MSKDVKQCPFCGEEILTIAKKCKHCGSVLDGSSDNAVASSQPAADYGIFLLAIPLVTAMLFFGWVPSLEPQSVKKTINLLMAATILGMAIVAAMEANKVGIKSDSKKGPYPAIAWFVLIVLFPMIFYPVYLRHRKHYGLTNLFVAGFFVFLVLCGSIAFTMTHMGKYA